MVNPQEMFPPLNEEEAKTREKEAQEKAAKEEKEKNDKEDKDGKDDKDKTVWESPAC